MARILCVDDEAVALQAKCAILNRAGYTVTAAHSAEEAIAQLQRETFDAVVTDWQLGQQSGYKVLRAAKDEMAEHQPVTVIVVSGHFDTAMRAAEPAADLYLEKPVDPEELVKALKALLGPEPTSMAS